MCEKCKNRIREVLKSANGENGEPNSDLDNLLKSIFGAGTSDTANESVAKRVLDGAFRKSIESVMVQVKRDLVLRDKYIATLEEKLESLQSDDGEMNEGMSKVSSLLGVLALQNGGHLKISMTDIEKLTEQGSVGLGVAEHDGYVYVIMASGADYFDTKMSAACGAEKAK